MKDSMTDIFRERFQGHESPVDPGLWTGITQQMAITAPIAEDGVGSFFKERFQGHETAVDPSIWQGISAQLGHGVVAGTSSGILGWAAAGAVAVVIGVAGYLVVNENATDEPYGQVAELVLPGKDIRTIPDDPSMEPVKSGLAPSVVSEKNNVVVDREPVAAISKPVSSEPVREKSDPKAVQDLGPVPANSMEATAASTTVVVNGPVVPAMIDAPEKVEQIIRELTNEVQMEVLTKGEDAVSIPEDPTTGTEQGEPEPLMENTIVPLPKLFMPNTFTPNGDGVNDTYTLSGIGYRTVMMRVYSMKNDQLVFSTNSAEPWTGNNCEDGMYMVAVEAITEDGRTMTQGKVVWLTRVRLN